MARVTITMPTYNYARFLGESIQSVLDQTYRDFELMIIDDGSTDNTREVVKSFKDPHIRYIYQEHKGVTAAENTSLKLARTEYQTGLGSDDLYLPQNLEVKVKFLDSHPDIGMVCSDAYVFDDRTGITIGRFWRNKKVSHFWVDPEKEVRHPVENLIVHGCWIAPQSCMIRRSVLDTVGIFDDLIPTCEDWDLFFRIVQRFPIEIIDEPLLKLRRHDSNLTNNLEEMYLGEVAVLNKLLRWQTLNKKEVALAKRRLTSLHFKYGRKEIMNGRTSAGRKDLLLGLKFNPWHVQPYYYLALSFLGSKRYLALKSWKRGLGQQLKVKPKTGTVQ